MTTDASRSAVVAAMATAAPMIAYQVASKATRDALFLSYFPITTLPPLLTSSAIVSIVVVLGFTRVLARWGPARVMPSMFLVNAALLLGVWALSFRNPPLAAIATYFHVAVLGPIVVSCFWSLISERFDARTARREIGRIGALGTLGGLMGGVLADRVAHWGGVLTMLPVLAGLHIVCAVAAMGVGSPRAPSAELASMNLSGGLRLLARDRYLRRIGLLTASGTLMAALLDYAFKADATATWNGGPALVRVFSVFYTGTALLTFVVQTAWGRRALERLGVAGTVALLPGTVALGGLGALIVPGFWSVAFARGGEAVVRNSLFRSGYELLFAPVAPEEKRVTKTIADVGFDRLGDALGGGLVALLLMLTPHGSLVPMLVVAVLLALGSLGLAVWFRRGYIDRLASGLVRSEAPPAPAGDPAAVLNRASIGGLDLSQTIDLAALTQRIDLADLRAQIGLGDAQASEPISPELWDLLTDIADLRSGESARVRAAITRRHTLDAERLPHLLMLLARDDMASSVLAALRDPPATLVARSATSCSIPRAISPRGAGCRGFSRAARTPAPPRCCSSGSRIRASRSEFSAVARCCGGRNAGPRGETRTAWRPPGSRTTACSPPSRARSMSDAACGRRSSRWSRRATATRARCSTAWWPSAPAPASSTCSRCCRSCSRASPSRSRSAGSTPRTRSIAAWRSSTWRACCRRRSASGCGPTSSTAAGEASRTATARRSSPTCCAPTSRCGSASTSYRVGASRRHSDVEPGPHEESIETALTPLRSTECD
jgi:hypothetical protein